MFLGGLGLLFLLAFVVAVFGIAIYAAVEASRIPDQQWTAAGQNKTLWIVLPLAGLAAGGCVGPVLGLVFLFAIKPKILEAVPGVTGPPAPGWWRASDGQWYPPQAPPPPPPPAY